MAELIEGEWYSFKIIKLIKLPSDNNKHYVLKDSENRSFLLPEEFYTNYGFVMGKQICCRIDKINCAGSYFLEPEHPVYRENKISDFVLDRIIEEKDLNGDNIQHYYVTDEFVNNIDFYSSVLISGKKKGDRIPCLVQKIRKGRLFLNLPEPPVIITSLQEGETYTFKILETRVLEKNDKDILLEDIFGKKHSIFWKDYKHYGLISGQTINCLIRKRQSTGSLVPEPENPEYKSGSKYYFNISDIENITDYFGSVRNIFIVKDIYNHEIKVPALEHQNNRINIGKSLLCEVLMFKKGRIYLKNAEKIIDIQD